MSELWTAVGAGAAALTVAVTLGGIIWQIREARVALGVDILLRLARRFETEEFRRIRRAAAESLREAPDHRLDDAIDFFETIGMLTRRGVLNAEVVSSEFSYWVFGYWLCASEYVQTRQSRDPVRWIELEWLYERLLREEFRQRRRRRWGRFSFRRFMPRPLGQTARARLEADLERITDDFLEEERHMPVSPNAAGFDPLPAEEAGGFGAGEIVHGGTADN